MRTEDGLGSDSDTIYFGLVKDLPIDPLLGGEFLPGFQMVAASGLPVGPPMSFSESQLNHRLGHVLGLPHAVHGTLGLDSAGQKIGWCGEHAPATTPNFPTFAQVNGGTFPTLGPMDAGDNELIYGVSPGYYLFADFRVISPFQTFELMSHCGFNRFDAGHFEWPSKYTYMGLTSRLLALSGPTLQSAGDSQEYLLVSGSIDWRNQTGQFNPFGKASLTAPLAPPAAGEYQLELRDDAGTSSKSSPFSPPAWTLARRRRPTWFLFFCPCRPIP